MFFIVLLFFVAECCLKNSTQEVVLTHALFFTVNLEGCLFWNGEPEVEARSHDDQEGEA